MCENIFRVSVRKFITVELCAAVVSFIIATSLPGSRDMTFVVLGFCLVHPVIYAPVGIVNGFDFVMYDAPPDAGANLYHFVSIALAMPIGLHFSSLFETIADGTRAALGL